MTTTAILIHGLHTGAVGWENLILGDINIFKLGRASTALSLANALQSEGQNIQLLIGTGASERDGKKEAEVIRDFMLAKIAELGPASWPFEGSKELLEGAVLDTTTQNTTQELANAVAYCEENGIGTLYIVSSSTHITRCYHEAVKLTYPDVSIIPIAADTGFTGYTPADVVIVEPPHRGDDPQTQLPPNLQGHNLVKRMFKARGKDPKGFAEAFDALLTQFGA